MKNTKKRFWSLITTVALIFSLFSCFIIPGSAAAEGTMVSNAVNVNFGTTYMKTWTASTDHLNHYVKIVVPEQGIITIKATKPYDDEGEYGRIEFNLYDQYIEAIWGNESFYSVDNPNPSYNVKIGLKAGTYYLTMKPGFTVRSGVIETYYSVSFAASTTCEVESNDSGAKANLVTLGKKYTGFFGADGGDNEECDYFKFNAVKGHKYRVCWYDFDRFEKTSTIATFIWADGDLDSVSYSSKIDADGLNYDESVATATGVAYLKIYNYHQEQFEYGFVIKNMTCEASGHTWDGGVVTRWSTCDRGGETTYTCYACGSAYTVQHSPLTHNWTNGVVTRWSTCDRGGEITYTCSYCGDTYAEEQSPLTHNWTNGVVTRWSTCHLGGEITYTCSYCGDTYAEQQSPLTHNWDSGVVTRWSTCHLGGEITYTCSYCGDTYAEQQSPLTHNWDSGVVTTAPTGSVSGIKTYTCSYCDGTKTESIPPLFNDVVTGSYYESPVNWAYERGITTGTSANTFGPDQACTRGQIVTFLWRAAGSPEPVSSHNPFRDVPSDQYYYKAVLWAVEKGITTGMSANSFAPDAPCTRGQIVTFLWRAKGQPAANSYNPFYDVSGSAYYYSPVLWAVKNGITTGMSANSFAPDSPCTRAQIVTFLYRAYK